MRPQTALNTLSPLLKKPFFTSQEAKEIGVHPSLLSHYVKTGHLKRVSRGVYQASDYQNPSAFRWEDLIEAVYAIKGGVVCLISALAIYDLTEEIPRQHWIAVRHGRSVKQNRNLKIIQLRNMELGKTEIELEGSLISIFDRERTIVDAFRLLSREIAIKALKTALAQGKKNRIDLVKLQAYAKKLRVNINPYLMSFTT
jgi:predicted transcriptional regulator of viral defense system